MFVPLSVQVVGRTVYVPPVDVPYEADGETGEDVAVFAGVVRERCYRSGMTTKRLHSPNATLAQRLALKLERRPSGCLEWTGYVDPQSGYGKVSNRPGTPLSVHVAAWLVVNGPVPLGLEVRHSCDNRVCAELTHLSLGTHAQNVQDMVDRQRYNNAPHLVCPLGHPHDGTDSEGFPQCLKCRNRTARKVMRERRVRSGRPTKGAACEGCWYLESGCKCAELGFGPYAPVLVVV